ncbi:unnamed protein product [Rangifer tarandus platyrhynchus]|uniref:Uncharacterized protein n=3 Tax=Rangifer tarandus platyrhynchus TaxID=3082113 RepID=A0ABN9A0V2_RANTA|nr:unnamed protein product [Rangifer tarandus platyrhynchus]CAI9714294.1 unnamed protein product [Rangifer tarandus platyrhynchus]
MKLWGPLLKIGESQHSNNRALKQAEGPLRTGPRRAAQAAPRGRPWPASHGLSHEGPEPSGADLPLEEDRNSQFKVASDVFQPTSIQGRTIHQSILPPTFTQGRTVHRSIPARWSASFSLLPPLDQKAESP